MNYWRRGWNIRSAFDTLKLIQGVCLFTSVSTTKRMNCNCTILLFRILYFITQYVFLFLIEPCEYNTDNVSNQFINSADVGRKGLTFVNDKTLRTNTRNLFSGGNKRIYLRVRFLLNDKFSRKCQSTLRFLEIWVIQSGTQRLADWAFLYCPLCNLFCCI